MKKDFYEKVTGIGFDQNFIGFNAITLSPKAHKLDVDIQIHILSLASRHIYFDPRIKFFRGKLNFSNKNIVTFSIEKKPRVMSGSSDFLDEYELKRVVDYISINRKNLLLFWKGKIKSTEDLVNSLVHLILLS